MRKHSDSSTTKQKSVSQSHAAFPSHLHPHSSRPPSLLTPSLVLSLQRSYGNRFVQRLLLAHSRPSPPSIQLEHENELFAAVNTDNLADVKKYANNTNVNATDQKWQTPLLIATSKGNKAIIEALLDAGADINKGDARYVRALHIAAEKGNQELVELLESKGADINATDNAFQSALVIAALNKHWAIAKWLLEKNAKIDSLTDKFIDFVGAVANDEEKKLTYQLVIRWMQEGNAFDRKKDSPTFIKRARQQLGTLKKIGELQSADSAENLAWTNQGPGLQKTEFGKWLLGGGSEPDPKSGVMNCWEVVLFGAYQAGYVDKPWLQAFYSQFNTSLNDKMALNLNPMTDTSIEDKLKASHEYVYDPNDPKSPKPLPGDIVTFESAMAHTAIALGTLQGGSPEVYSLWNKPNNHKYLQRTTVAALLAAGAKRPVEFFSAKWS